MNTILNQFPLRSLLEFTEADLSAAAAEATARCALKRAPRSKPGRPVTAKTCLKLETAKHFFLKRDGLRAWIKVFLDKA